MILPGDSTAPPVPPSILAAPFKTRKATGGTISICVKKGVEKKVTTEETTPGLVTPSSAKRLDSVEGLCLTGLLLHFHVISSGVVGIDQNAYGTSFSVHFRSG